jgi:hypothetical protein
MIKFMTNRQSEGANDKIIQMGNIAADFAWRT